MGVHLQDALVAVEPQDVSMQRQVLPSQGVLSGGAASFRANERSRARLAWA